MQSELLSLLLAAGPARKLHIPALREKLPAAQRAGARFFDSPRLNDSILIKRVTSDIAGGGEPRADEPMSMVAFLPPDADGSDAGGPAVLAVVSVEGTAQHLQWLGQENAAASELDIRKLKTLVALPTFSPAVVDLALHRADISVPTCYGHMRADLRAIINEHLCARLRSLITSLVVPSAADVEEMVDCFLRLLRSTDSDAVAGIAPLAHALNLPVESAWDYFLPWVALAIYECEAAALKSRVREFVSWLDVALPREGLRSDDMKIMASLARTNHRRTRHAWNELIRIFREFRTAHEGLVFAGNVQGFAQFLRASPAFFLRIGDVLGRLEHCVLVWDRSVRDHDGRALPYAEFFHLLNNLTYLLAGPSARPWSSRRVTGGTAFCA